MILRLDNFYFDCGWCGRVVQLGPATSVLSISVNDWLRVGGTYQLDNCCLASKAS